MTRYKCTVAILIVLFCFTAPSFARSNKHAARYSCKDFPRMYAHIGIMPLNTFTGSRPESSHYNFLQWGFHIEYLDYGLQFERRNLHAAAKALPADYIPGQPYFGYDEPTDRLTERIITAKKLFYTNSKFVQLVAQAGISFIDLSQAADFRPQSNTGSGMGIDLSKSSNYSYSQLYRSFTGLHLKIGADFTLTPVLGLNAHAFSTLSRSFRYTGLGVSLNVGYIRKIYKL